jgi:hypothetical protein
MYPPLSLRIFAGICRPTWWTGAGASLDPCSFGPPVVYMLWNRIAFARGSEEIGMETMKIHVLERALTAACIVAAIAVVWWGIKILSA